MQELRLGGDCSWVPSRCHAAARPGCFAALACLSGAIGRAGLTPCGVRPRLASPSWSRTPQQRADQDPVDRTKYWEMPGPVPVWKRCEHLTVLSVQFDPLSLLPSRPLIIEALCLEVNSRPDKMWPRRAACGVVILAVIGALLDAATALPTVENATPPNVQKQVRILPDTHKCLRHADACDLARA